jgi:penicillin-binding protein 1A
MNGPVRPIHTEADHAAALAEIDTLFAFEPGSPEADRLEVLAVLVAEYERVHEGHMAAHPVEVLSMSMKAQGRTQADLATLLGSRSRASEVLCRRRQLSTPMVEKIARAWAIPSSLLSAPYTVESRIPNILKTTTALLAIVVALSAVTIGSVFAWYGADLPTSAQIAATLEGSGPNAPGFTPLNELPPEVIKAFLAAEDEDFYSHDGYSLNAILHASWHTLGSGKVQGGATITQQLAKNVLLKESPSVSRKVKEIILAQRLEKALTKDRILEAYFNRIYFGGTQYGIASASERYFHKKPSELSIAESAYLAGLPKAPNAYRLDVAGNLIRARERRDWVLARMAADGMITASAARFASAEPLTAPDRN